jgi:hypothetical protein
LKIVERNFKRNAEFVASDLMFLETSAKSGQNVVEAFTKCAKAIVTKIESGELDPDRIGSGIQYGNLRPSSRAAAAATGRSCPCKV